MTATGDARQALYTMLALSIDDAVAHVSAHQPDEVATPAVWIDVARRRANDDGVGLVVTLPVVAVVDGADRAQLDALDRIGDLIWQAAGEVGAPRSDEPYDLDVGGPRLRALTTYVDVDVFADTLCPTPITMEAAR